MVKDIDQIVASNSENSYNFDDEEDKDEEDFKGALKITRIRNRKYVRMPNFSKRSVNILKNWLNSHLDNPYPTHKEKDVLSRESGLSKKQIQNWFTNARKRIWQPMIKTQENKEFIYRNTIDSQSSQSVFQNPQPYQNYQAQMQQRDFAIGFQTRINSDPCFQLSSLKNDQSNVIIIDQYQLQNGINAQSSYQNVPLSNTMTVPQNFQRNNNSFIDHSQLIFNTVNSDQQISNTNLMTTHVQQPTLLKNNNNQLQPLQFNHMLGQLPAPQLQSLYNQGGTLSQKNILPYQQNVSNMQFKPIIQNSSYAPQEQLIQSPMHRPIPYYHQNNSVQGLQTQNANSQFMMPSQGGKTNNQSFVFLPPKTLFQPMEMAQQLQLMQGQTLPPFRSQPL